MLPSFILVGKGNIMRPETESRGWNPGSVSNSTPAATPDWGRYWSDRMNRQLRIRNYSPHTLKNYDLAVRAFLGTRPGPPRRWTAGLIEGFLLDLKARRHYSPSTVNLFRDALWFLCKNVAKVPECMRSVPKLKEDQKLPPVLGQSQIQAAISGLLNPKHRLALSLAYGCGLRVSELAALRIED